MSSKPETQAAAPAAQAAPAKKPAAAPDEHHGKGGLFTRVSGKRALQERTKTAEEAQAEDDAKAKASARKG